MLATILLAVMAFSCANTKIINETEYPWNSHDQKMLDYSKKRCSELYKNSPCVKLFKKWGKKDYSVICGREKKSENVIQNQRI